MTPVLGGPARSRAAAGGAGARLDVVHLDVFYGHFHALFDLSLSVDAGETAAIIGANGAGKSTLLKSIAGVLHTEPGAILLDGEPIGRLRADERVRAGIALVPEGRRVFASLTVQENLLVGAHARCGAGSAWTVERVFALFPILAERPRQVAGSLSGGQQQALAIGRALMANPRLLLLDEISLGLAPVVVKQLYETLPGVAAEGTTLVLVEQDVSRALAVADRAYCLLEGRVSLTGNPSELSLEAISAAYFGSEQQAHAAG